MKIDLDDDVIVRGKKFGVPAIAPLVADWNLRSAMHDEFHGIFLIGIKVRRLDEEALDFVVIGAGEPEGLQR